MRVFISYRREDSAGYTGRLYDSLRARIGQDNIFLDLNGIDSGENFVTVINTAIQTCNVALAVIGPEWLTCAANGRRRLDDQDDLVRGEIVTALTNHIPVIPVLVGGASPPLAAALPDALKPLAVIDAHEISDARWVYDVDRLIEAIEKRGAAADRNRPGRRRWVAAAAVAGLVMLLVGAVIFGLQDAATPASTSTSVSDRGAGAARAAGMWSADVTYPWGVRQTERLTFEVDGNTLSGTASFLGIPRGIVDGTVNGERLAFTTRTRELAGDDTHDVVNRYRGRISGDSIAFTMQSEGGNSSVPVAFTAHKAER